MVNREQDSFVVTNGTRTILIDIKNHLEGKIGQVTDKETIAYLIFDAWYRQVGAIKLIPRSELAGVAKHHQGYEISQPILAMLQSLAGHETLEKTLQTIVEDYFDRMMHGLLNLEDEESPQLRLPFPIFEIPELNYIG